MPLRLSTADADFEPRFRDLLDMKREVSEEVDQVVAAIIADVRRRGDQALIEYTSRFDRVDLTPATLRIPEADIDRALGAVDKRTWAALELAADRIESFHARQMPADLRYTDASGVELGYRWTPVSAVGLYVPGGKAAYPSSVLMNALPARVAGVERRVMVMPTPGGEVNPLLLAAAKLAGIHEVYRIGGAQAVAALAYGTATIAPVDKIMGPGNAYVAAAKRQVFGTVGIDMIAGPSEVLVVADGNNDPAWIAADLLAQAEHDEAAQSILMTDDGAFAGAILRAVEAALAVLPRAAIARESWERHGAIVLLRSLDEAPALVDRVAPEHLELAVDDPEALFARIRHAGAVFLGRHTPEAVGDYVAGPNHVLPTARSARFSSGLSTLDFLKRTTLLRCDPDSLGRIGPAAVMLAEAEGLGAHGRSVSIRMNRRV